MYRRMINIKCTDRWADKYGFTFSFTIECLPDSCLFCLLFLLIFIFFIFSQSVCGPGAGRRGNVNSYFLAGRHMSWFPVSRVLFK